MRIGAVMLPAPTPVTPMARAMTKPARISTTPVYPIANRDYGLQDFWRLLFGRGWDHLNFVESHIALHHGGGDFIAHFYRLQNFRFVHVISHRHCVHPAFDLGMVEGDVTGFGVYGLDLALEGVDLISLRH